MVAYRDMWGKGTDSYLHMMYERLALMRDLLTDTGTIYVHAGWIVSHYVKAVLDDIFGREHFLNQIIWKRQTAHSDTGQGAAHLGRLHDVIFIYTKGERYTWTPQFQEYDAKYLETHYRNIEPETGRRYELDNLIGPGGAGKGNPGALGGRRLTEDGTDAPPRGIRPEPSPRSECPRTPANRVA